MDRKSAKLLGLFSAGLLIASVAIAADDKNPLRAMAWLAPVGQFEALSKTLIIAAPSKDKLEPKFEMGRIFFQTPMVLGGQAAKAGISCESCHQSGASNPHFLFPGVSNRPGTADVTHSFFSKLRGNGKFDPIPIPDLTKPGKISHEGQALEFFIRDLIVEEFSGEEPSKETIAALASYVRSLKGSEVQGQRSHTLDQPLKNISVTVSLAKSSVRSNAPKTSKLLLASARHQLGLIHERYAGSRLKKHRHNLLQAGTSLGEIQNQLDQNPEQVSSALLRWDKLFVATEKMLRRDEAKSLYNPDRLKAVIGK